MPSAIRLREDYSAEALRALARRSKDANQSRRLLSLPAVRDGRERSSAAELGGRGRRSAGWTPRPCVTGPSLKRVGSGGPRRQLDGGSQASSFGGATGSVRADRRGGSGSWAGRGRALAAARPQ